MAEPLWTSADIASATGGDPFGEPFDAAGVQIDSREVAPGDLFVALRAERDGHDFVPAALERGAAGTLASRWPVAGSGVLVSDSLEGLGAMAVAARTRAPNARRAAITGSVGKTSVTQLVLSGLKLAGAAHGSVRSFNNHIGMPLTLTRMPTATRRAVFEIGMNHAGEIAPLSRMAAPHVVAITTVEAAHAENFADGEIGVARAKAEIFEGLEPGGAAVINADNRWAGLLLDAAREAGAKPLLFGSKDDADAQLAAFTPGPSGAVVEARVEGRTLRFSTKQSAAHWGPMSLCALLVMRALDVEMPLALAALEGLRAAGRPRRRADRRTRGRGLHRDRRELQRQPGLRGRGAPGLGCASGSTHRRVDRHAGTGRRRAAPRRTGRRRRRRERRPRLLRRPAHEVAVARTARRSPRRLGAGRRRSRPRGRRRRAGGRPRHGQGLQGLQGQPRPRGAGERLMFYLLFQYAVAHHLDFPGLNLLRFLTFRGGAAVATAQLVVVLMGSRFIRWMRTKQGRGQPIREDGIQRHIVEKAGTPTMGGLMFLAGITVATLLWADLSNVYVWVMLMVTLAFGGLGFLDDYAKVTKQTTAGISGRMRLAVEAAVAIAAVFLMIRFGQPRRRASTCPPPWCSRSSRRRSSTSAGSIWRSGPSSSSARPTR